jgi:hypothetical protein
VCRGGECACWGKALICEYEDEVQVVGVCVVKRVT